MQQRNNQQRGQALILIVLAIVGMVALTALAVDGGSVYSDRRHAQNAADTAALAAGLARIRQSASAPVDAWRDAGYSVATTNGYEQAGATSTVVVSLCSDTGVTCPLPAQVPNADGSMSDTDPSQFVKVTITSTIRTYFAPVVGIRQLTNQVDAIVRAIPSQETQYFNGSPLASVMPHCKKDYPSWPNNPFEISGSATITVKGSPIFDNSDCEPDFDVQLSSGGSLSSPDGIWLRGTYDNLVGLVAPPVAGVKQHYGTYIDPASYVQPNLDDECAALPKNPAIIHNPDNTYTALPGRYTGSSFPAMGGGQTVYLMRGLYCLYNGMTFNNGILTTDLPGGTPGVYDANEGVLFYVPSGDVDLHGNATINIHAITSNTCPQSGENGLLIYLPNSNDNSVNIGGGSGSTYTGSIIAPSSLVQISGSSGSSSDQLTLETQIIGFSIKISGGGLININFNKCLTAMTRLNPQLQPYK